MNQNERDYRTLSQNSSFHNKTIVSSLVVVLLCVFAILLTLLFTYGSRLTALEKDVEYIKHMTRLNSITKQ